MLIPKVPRSRRLDQGGLGGVGGGVFTLRPRRPHINAEQVEGTFHCNEKGEENSSSSPLLNQEVLLESGLG